MSIREDGIESMGRYYGTYMGIVKHTKDPEEVNRLLLFIPEVMGVKGKLVWAFPKGQFGGKGYGAQAQPSLGDTVWVTYRHGHPQHALWEHGFFAKDEKPEEFKELDTYGFITPGGIKVLLKDSDGSVSVETKEGNKINVKDEDNSISLENGDGIKLEIKGKEVKVGNSLQYLTIGDELKPILEELQEHLAAWSIPIKSFVGVGIGEAAAIPDVGLVNWRAKLKDFLTKYA